MADFLYFRLGDESDGDVKYGYNPDESAVYSYATVKMTSSSGDSSYLDLYEGGATESSSVAMMSGSTEPAYAKLPDNYGQYDAFLFELWNSSPALVAWQSYTLAEALKGGHIVDATGQGTALQVAKVVPEPTGGLLMLLGMAVLALRRKARTI